MTQPNWRRWQLDTRPFAHLLCCHARLYTGHPRLPFSKSASKAWRAGTSLVLGPAKPDQSPGHDQFRQRGGIRISSSSCALVSSVAVNFKSTASFTIVSSPVILSGSTAARGKNSSRVRLALASLMLSQSALIFKAFGSVYMELIV